MESTDDLIKYNFAIKIKNLIGCDFSFYFTIDLSCFDNRNDNIVFFIEYIGIVFDLDTEQAVDKKRKIQ